jgi:signal transduction histidine kinase
MSQSGGGFCFFSILYSLFAGGRFCPEHPRSTRRRPVPARRSHFDGVGVHIDAPAARQMDRLAALPTQVLYYAVREAVRNAARYGRGETLDRSLHLSLRAQAKAEGLSISVEDDGIGLVNLQEHTRNGGAGHGLALHSTLLAVLGGTLAVETLVPAAPSAANPAGPGTRVLIHFPLDGVGQDASSA